MWEYKNIWQQVSVFGEAPSSDYMQEQEDKFNAKLRELGVDGWELTSVIERKYDHTSNIASGSPARLWYGWLKRWVAD